MPSLADQEVTVANQKLLQRFQKIRAQSVRLCDPLEIEDFSAQPCVDVSPPKWHLGHTTWFFENFLLVPHLPDYQVFHQDFCFLFNSYYVTVGDRWTRAERGFLTRPTVREVLDYRKYVEEKMEAFLQAFPLDSKLQHVFEVGLQHEQQHQELLLYDIKYILGMNPLFPVYVELDDSSNSNIKKEWLDIPGGQYQIGHQGGDFHFDNEEGVHQVFLHDYGIASSPVTNGEYLQFMESGGYESFQYWLSEGWDWVQQNGCKAPLYWHFENDKWFHYTLGGFKQIQLDDPIAHVSFYEADAFAKWKGLRLPTEFEWEVACRQYESEVPKSANFVEEEHFKPIQNPGFHGNLWEWTSSAYRPYPFYQAEEGALGEYNGKFMMNQMVLRGGSYATPRDHIRATYRNFFHPHLQWLFSGFRLARYK
ncbi:MAG: ergothioneine biosynthesis protein EgtB [Cyclobacteriaceae bacterium]|nr:ergothioneine biosynthesis protein EgtB [Cyclobacteriaceae bacterium HetDA_MAG_MS6]